MKTLLTCLLLCFSTAVVAIDSFELPQDPQLAERYKALSQEFRCLVCQNQNLADSGAGLATDLKQEIIRLLEAGKTDNQIRDFLSKRYGDFVLYRPRVAPTTWVLWAGPFALLLIVCAMLIWHLKRKKVTLKSKPITTNTTALHRIRGQKDNL